MGARRSSFHTQVKAAERLEVRGEDIYRIVCTASITIIVMVMFKSNEASIPFRSVFEQRDGLEFLLLSLTGPDQPEEV